jgi:hypothetical protein
MQIVEIGDCSMVIMKDSGDPPWMSVGYYYREAKENNHSIVVSTGHHPECMVSDNFIYAGGRLVVFFKDSIKDKFSLHDKVNIYLF